MTEKENFLSVPGGRIFVKSWHPLLVSENTPLLLLHDSLGCVGTWQGFPLRLSQAAQRTVIAYDRLGFGKSTARTDPLAFSFIEDETQVLRVLLQRLAVKDFVFFGHSVGGAMALSAAGLLENCKGVVTEAAQSFVEERTLQGILAAKAEFADARKKERLARYHGDKTDWVLRAWMDTWLAPEFRGWNLDRALPKVPCPILALHGDRDEYGSEKFPEKIVSLSPGPSRMVWLENCGHVPHKEREVEVLAAVTQFLSG